MESNQIVALTTNIVILTFIINGIKYNKLQEKYALLWILSSLTFIIFSMWYKPIILLSQIVGIENPMHLLIITGGAYLIIINLHFSFTLSKISHNQYKIIQQISLLEEKLKRSYNNK